VTAPDWAISVPSTSGVHNPPPSSVQWTGMGQQQLDALRSQLVESILQVVVTDITGVLLPGPAGQQLAAWAIAVLEDIGGFGNQFVALISALGAEVWADVVSLIQLAVDIAQQWAAALSALNLANPLSFVQQIPQSIPALVRDPEGGLSAVGSGLTRDAEGAITFVEDGLTHIAQQADQGLLSLQQVAEQMLHAATTVAPTLGGGVADVINAGQTAHTALTSAIEQAGGHCRE
jgi:hypothetical protein